MTSPRYELSDAQWDTIREFLPTNGQRGQQWKDHRLVIDGILWALSDGGRWRNVPGRFGNWKTVYERFRRWSQEGLWDEILGELQARKAACRATSTGSCSPSTGASSGPTSRPPGRRKRLARGGAGGPRPGPQPGRVRDQAAPGRGDRGRGGPAAGGRGQPRVSSTRPSGSCRWSRPWTGRGCCQRRR